VTEIAIAGFIAEDTVTVIGFEVTLVGLAHNKFEVSTQVTTCPLVSADVLKVEPVPELTFPTFH